MSSWTHEPRYQSARCLMCGCCLEVCPNFSANGTFAGAVAAVNAFRILNEEQERLEFLDKGFQGASLRNIVKEAGVTTASFYWYYSSKEELYDALVGEHYNHILQMYDDALELFWKMTKEDQKLHMGDIGGQCMVDMVEYMYSHLTAFKMLLIASAGTKYENLLHELTQREIDSTHEFEKHMKELGHPMGTQVEPALEHSITSGMFGGMFELVIHDVPKEKAVRCVRQLHAFYTAGWRKLMGM